MTNKSPIHLVIVDALNLIRRIDGALRGFSKTEKIDANQLLTLSQQALNKLIKGHCPSHIVAVFDGDGNNWRKHFYPDYKANRKPMADDLKQLLPTIISQWQAQGIESITPEHDEADDIIATLAHKIVQHKNQCTIVSTDSGFWQLIPQGINIWDHFSGQWVHHEQVYKKFSVRPQQLIDYWSIVGQSGNKIPGINGMGPKAALAILADFGDLKTAFSTDEPDHKLLTKLQKNKDQAQISYRLVLLKQDIALGINLRNYAYTMPAKES
jgi:protein Xni